MPTHKPTEIGWKARNASRTTLVPNARRDLCDAMKLVAETGCGSAEQPLSAGRSIKWRGN